MHSLFRTRVVLTIAFSCFSMMVSANAGANAEIDSTNLRLRDAINATLQHNPQLAGYEFRVRALEGEQQTAALKPQLRATTQVENIAGTGEFSGVAAGELTLSLSSVIELGGKQDARLNLITARQQQLAASQRLRTLEVLTQVTQQFIALAATQEQLSLLLQTQQLAEDNLGPLNKQVQAGRTHEAELLRAKAALARATIEVQKTRQQLVAERLKLSAFWADTEPAFTQVDANLLVLPPAESLPVLLARLDNNPDLALLGDDVHLRAAELRQVQTERKTNLEWNAGVRRLQASGDSALVIGMSVPLGASLRAAGAIASAQAQHAGAEQERDSARIQLQAQLVILHGAYQQALAEVNALQRDVLPPLKQAMRVTADAFNQGRYSYLELSLAQRELLDTQLALIAAAARAHTLNADIERLTGAADGITSPPTIHSDARKLP